MGYQLLFASSQSEKDITHPTWTLSLPKKEQVIRVINSRKGPIASLGRVTDGRGTLYKYLNPHLHAVLTSAGKKKSKCAVYVVDTVSGSIVYHAMFVGGGVDCEDVHVALSDNTLIYTYWDNGEVKGQRVVSVELYEGSQVDDKTKRLVYLFRPLVCSVVTDVVNIVRSCRLIRVRWQMFRYLNSRIFFRMVLQLYRRHLPNSAWQSRISSVSLFRSLVWCHVLFI